jgi:hypothetical protein
VGLEQFFEIDPSLYQVGGIGLFQLFLGGIEQCGQSGAIGTPARDRERDELRWSFSCDISMDACICVTIRETTC